jgi:hypothetical protein
MTLKTIDILREKGSEYEYHYEKLQSIFINQSGT